MNVSVHFATILIAFHVFKKNFQCSGTIQQIANKNPKQKTRPST